MSLFDKFWKNIPKGKNSPPMGSAPVKGSPPPMGSVPVSGIQPVPQALLTLIHFWRRFWFDRKERVIVWKLMYALLAAGFSVDKAAAIVSETYRLQKKTSITKIFEEIEAGIKLGNFSSAISRYIPGSESLIFSAYGKTDVTRLFKAAARIAEMQMMISSALRKNIGPPIAMFLLFYALVWGAGGFFIPEFAKLIPVESWPYPANIYAGICLYVYDHFLTLCIASGVAIALLWAATLNWTGPGRKELDAIPPFNLYRFITGTSFLFTIMELMNAGIDLNTKTFQTMEQNGSGYLRNRISRIRHFRSKGFGLGKSMQMADQGFPSPELIPIIVALDGTKDWIEQLQSFSDLWILQATDMVQEKSAIIKNLLIGLLTAFIGLTFHTVFSLMSSITDIQV